MTEFCKGWSVPSPSFAQVIVAAAVLEDPFASASVPDRIPTLIRRFVSRLKRSRKVTSFETLESTMTLLELSNNSSCHAGWPVTDIALHS